MRYPIRFSDPKGHSKGFLATDLTSLRHYAKTKLGLTPGFVDIAHMLDLVGFFEKRGYRVEYEE